VRLLRHNAWMTNDEFNQCQLKVKLDFRMIEAARFVLVHAGSVDTAVALYFAQVADGKQKVLSAIKLFEEYLNDRD